jgi:hypothetical protein
MSKIFVAVAIKHDPFIQKKQFDEDKCFVSKRLNDISEICCYAKCKISQNKANKNGYWIGEKAMKRGLVTHSCDHKTSTE